LAKKVGSNPVEKFLFIDTFFVHGAAILYWQRLSLRKKLGYRDASKYRMNAGDGANQKYKRQG